MALSLIQKAIDTMSVWADKINAGFTQTDQNETDIATNTADIATNTADIATNTADIATNTADIATNTADIATNTADIATLPEQDRLLLDTAAPQAWVAGQLSFDADSGTVLADTAYSEVRVNVGQETHVPFLNNTGVTIPAGTVVNSGGVSGGEILGIKIDISSPAFSSAPLGVATHDVAHGARGLATKIGVVRGIDTSTLTPGGVLYAGTTAGSVSQSFPLSPNKVIIVGTVLVQHATTGEIFCDVHPYTRRIASKSYSFSQAGVGTGDYYVGGFYDAPAASSTIASMAGTVTHGSANHPYEAHAFVVGAGGAAVTGGVAGLRARGVSMDTTTGTTTADDTEVISTDITAITLNQYLETPKKWMGTVQFELYTVSGTPTVTSGLTFNYGYAKYEDFGNIDATITGFECVGTAANTDASFNIELLKHTDTNWTYHATVFVPGDGPIVELQDQSPYHALASGEPFAFKRYSLNDFIEGSNNEGIVVRLDCNAPNSVQSMSIHVVAVQESLA
jgi:hypothetical protein